MKKLLLPLLIIPCALQAQIYRCESKGDSYFSQIPCAEDSEVVIIEDRQMLAETPQGGVAVPEETVVPAEPVRSPADNMKSFVATLQRQRTEQLQNIDREIGELEAQMSPENETPLDSGEQDLAQAKLLGLQAARTSVETEYKSMIMEAESRVIALTGSE